MENNTIDKINEMIKLLKNNNNEYEIKNVKKNNMSDKTLKAYRLKYLFKGSKISPKILNYIIYEMYNDGVVNDSSLINKIGYVVNENKELLDNQGRLIDKDDINRELAIYYKNKLMSNYSDNKSIFDKDYKNDRYKTMLLKMKLESSKIELYKLKDSNHNKNVRDIFTQDMRNGLGKC